MRSRVLPGVAVIVAMALGHLLTSRLEVGAVSSEPFERTAAVGGTAHLSYADVRVEDVRGAAALAPPGSDTLAVAPGGVFLVVTLALRATRESTTFSTIVLVDEQDRRYQPSPRSDCPLTPTSDTGVTTHVMICFDVPAGVLVGSHLLVARGQQDTDSLRRDGVAVANLGIDAEKSRTIAGATSSYVTQRQSTAPIEPIAVTVTEPGS